ncbi:MAG: hypothetical protein H6R02_1488, partial [Burkholderiaceae bacterium]|nr:hypothetical protein [Burkholderiaceae bacterium]
RRGPAQYNDTGVMTLVVNHDGNAKLRRDGRRPPVACFSPTAHPCDYQRITRGPISAPITAGIDKPITYQTARNGASSSGQCSR